MLDHYFVRPETVNRIRSSWIGPLIEQYLMSLHERGYAVRRLGQRVPILVQFGKFAPNPWCPELCRASRVPRAVRRSVDQPARSSTEVTDVLVAPERFKVRWSGC
jgi:hypothetical protein